MLAISGERSTGEDVRVQNVTAVAAVANIVKVRKCTYNTSMQKTNTNNKKCVCIYIYKRQCECVWMWKWVCMYLHLWHVLIGGGTLQCCCSS